MFDLSVLVATTNLKERSVLENLGAISFSDSFSQHILDTAQTSGEVYRKARELAPDLIIVEDRLFTASLNLLCEHCDVIVIADTRVSDCGNIRYCYRPIQIAYLSKKMTKMYNALDPAKLEKARAVRKESFAMLPTEFPERDEPRLRHPEISLIEERRGNLAQIRDGSFTFTPEERHAEKESQINFYSREVLAMMDEQEGDSASGNEVVNAVWAVKPKKTVYLPGETASGMGGKARLVYRNGGYEEVPVLDENLPSDPIIRSGMTEIVYRFHGIELRLPISVDGNKLMELIVIHPCRTEYMAGDRPDVAGLILYGKRADNSVGPITDFTYDDRPLTGQDTKIVFRAEDQEIGIPIHVKENTILSAELRSPPKLLYQYGEELDLSESLVDIQYVDGQTTQKPLSASDLAVPFNPMKEGTQVLLFKAGLGAIPVTVEVLPKKKERTPTAIVIYSRPIRDTYPMGFKDLDVAGGMITVCYSDDTSEQIPMDGEKMSFEVTQKDKASAIVSVSYLGLSTNFMITLTEPKLVKLTVKTPPKKVNYVDNDLFNPEGMVLIGEYDNGETGEITDFPDMRKPVRYGDTLFPVRMDGVSVPVFIKVEERDTASALVLKALPVKTEYIVGEKNLDLFGGAVVLMNEAGNEKRLDITECAVHGFHGDRIGRQQIILAYHGMTCSFEITVRDRILEKIAIGSLPVKRKYFNGQDYELSGLIVDAIYDNGDKEIVTDFEVDKKVAEVGDTRVTVSYGGKTAFFTVSVTERVVENISITKMPTKTEYMENKDYFSASGGELLVVYNDKSTELVPITGEMVSGFSNKEPGHFNLTVSYGGKETELPVTVMAKQLIGMAISTPPYKTEYLAGECFDPSGMKVLGIYSNGETKPIYDYQCDPSGPLRETDGGVMIFFMNCSTACKVTVAPAPAPVDAPVEEPVPYEEAEEKEEDAGIPVFYPSSFGLRFDE